MELWAGYRINRELLVEDLQVFIDIFNFLVGDKWTRMETRTYPCGDKNVPVTVIIGITLYQPVIGVMMAVLGLHG